MRKIVVSIQNGLLAEALTQLLSASGEFEPYRTAVDKNKRAVAACVACNADLVLMEVTHTAHTSLETRLHEGEQIRQLIPGCKIVLLCDEKVFEETDPFLHFTEDFEKAASTLREIKYRSAKPEDIAMLAAVAQFYDGDWAGILDADLVMKVWSPLCLGIKKGTHFRIENGYPFLFRHICFGARKLRI